VGVVIVTKQPAHRRNIGPFLSPARARTTEREDTIEGLSLVGTVAEILFDDSLQHELTGQLKPFRSRHPVVAEIDSRSRKLNEEGE
jgi:hypothetical protein